MHRSIAAVPALLLVGVLGTACSSNTTSGAPDSSPPSTGSSTSASTSAPSTSAPATTSSGPSSGPSTGASVGTGSSIPSASVLKSIVVQQSDLPAGWVGKTAAADTAQDKQLDAQLDACVGSAGNAERDQVQQVKSDDFTKGEATVSSDASSYKSETDVTEQVAALKSPKAQPCISSLFRKEIDASVPQSATLTGIVIKLDTSHNGGISNLAGFANGYVSLTVQGKTIRVYIGAAFFTGPQLTGSVSFTSLGTPILSSFADPIVAAVAKRAANA